MEFSDVIYDLIDDVNARLAQHGPQTVTTVVGQATVLKVFKLSGKLKGTVIAGVRLDHGRIADGGMIRVMRQAPPDEGGSTPIRVARQGAQKQWPSRHAFVGLSSTSQQRSHTRLSSTG